MYITADIENPTLHYQSPRLDAPYAPPTMGRSQELDTYVDAEVPVFVAALGWVLLVFGGAWAFCLAVCGWGNIQSCETSWLKVKATCKA